VLLQGLNCCDLDMPPVHPTSPGATPLSKNANPSQPADADDEIEYIMPAQFLLGNPRWHGSWAGSIKRIYPAAAADNAAAVGGHHSRGVSLDWPGRVPGSTWRKSVEVPAAAAAVSAGEQGAAGAGDKAEGGLQADAAVAVRSKASVGEWSMQCCLHAGVLVDRASCVAEA
jgi:hypothetical protein